MQKQLYIDLPALLDWYCPSSLQNPAKIELPCSQNAAGGVTKWLQPKCVFISFHERTAVLAIRGYWSSRMWSFVPFSCHSASAFKQANFNLCISPGKDRAMGKQLSHSWRWLHFFKKVFVLIRKNTTSLFSFFLLVGTAEGVSAESWPVASKSDFYGSKAPVATPKTQQFKGWPAVSPS